MRSRYTAFVKQEFDYLIDTHHQDYRQGLTAQTLGQMPKTQCWDCRLSSGNL